MKIGIVSPYPPSKGTLNEYAFHLVQALLDRSDIEQIVVFSDDSRSTEEYKVHTQYPKMIIEASWSFNSLLNPIRIFRAIKEAELDVVLFNVQFLSFGDRKIAAALGLFIPAICRLVGVKSVVLLHNILETVDLDKAGISSNSWLNKLYNLIGTALTKSLLMADAVALTLPRYQSIIESKYQAKNVVHIPHGTFDVPAADIDRHKTGDIQILTFGKFGTYKKVESLIEAAQIVRERLKKEIKLVIAGTDNPNAKGYLRQVSEHYAHVDNIEYTGYVDEDDVPGLFINSSFVVFDYCSTTGSSGVLHQAGSFGKAVILPKIDDLKELIESEGYEGLYFDSGNVVQLANAIEELIVNTELKARLEKKNLEAAQSLPMSEVADRYMDLFRQITQPSSQPQLKGL